MGAVLIPPEAMPEELRELWRYIYEDDEDATYVIDDELWPPDGEPDDDAIYDRAAELEEGLVAERGADARYVDANGVWLVTVPEDYVTEDGRTMGELDEAERLLCVEVANCAEALRRRGRVPADGDPLDVDYLDCPPRDGGAVYCP